MSILEELNSLLSAVVAVSTGAYLDAPPDEYVVLTPLSAEFEVYADNLPEENIEEVRVSLFSKKNYIQRKNQLVRLLLQADFTITGRRYAGFEPDTKYHNYAIDVAKISNEI